MELLSKYVEFKNGKKRPISKGIIPVYGGNGILDYTNTANMQSGVVIGRVGVYCGSVFLVREECWVSDNAIKAMCKENMDLGYLYYLLSSLHLNERRIGTSQPLLTQNILNNIEVEIPELAIQKKISSTLELLDEKIKLNNEINNNLEQQAKTLFKSWFVDFEPFDESFVDSPIGTKIPHSLQMVQIGSLSHILETGKRPKGGAVATGVPSIGAENVKRLGEVNFASAKYIPVEFAQKMDKGKVHGYELMLYKDGGKPGTFIPHIVCGRTDMRKSIDGLCAIIQEQFSMEIDHALFLFCGRRCDRIKAILKEPDGIVMIYKRLTAQGAYRWPRNRSEVRNLTWREFDWLMSGIDIEQPKAIKAT